MHGSLALARGVLYVGLHAKTAHVHAFDLGGRPLGPAFSFRDGRAGRSAAAGLALDDGHALWIADTPADRVRVFTLFGREIGAIGSPAPAGDAPVLPGVVARPVDVDVGATGGGEEYVAIACGGERRHAVLVFDAERAFHASLASLGDPLRPYRSVCRLAALGERLLVAESAARRVQEFRSGRFHAAFRLAARNGETYEPCALALLEDGRALVACRTPESALFLVDRTGQPLARLAGDGPGEGEVQEPTDVAVERGVEDRYARVFVLDRDGLRLQAFRMDGNCLGAIPLAPTAQTFARRRRGGGR